MIEPAMSVTQAFNYDKDFANQDKMSYFVGAVCLLVSSLHSAQAYSQNCTSDVCDMKTCTNTSSACQQSCYSRNCKMTCGSPAGCIGNCALGGCSKVSCDVPGNIQGVSFCGLTCERDCPNLSCKAKSCRTECRKDNCKITCDGRGANSYCYAKCGGKNCSIDVKSENAEVSCDGSCRIRFGTATNGAVGCRGGGCSLTCAKGKSCSYMSPCPNCTGPVFVDDPFATGSGSRVTQVHAVWNILFMTLVYCITAMML